MSYFKKIVCDIDDTISFTTSRDWVNATPNLKLIQKLNKLFDNGWEIEYYTARGSISFDTREDAKNYYLPIIEEWFKKHNVKYTLISFDKPLAAYYIDDKAITPDDFLNIEIETLNGGLSGAIIERRGNKVYKTHKNSISSCKWFKYASNYVKTPKVYSLIGETICMEFIEKTDEVKVEQIDSIIDKFSKIPSKNDFSSYINRIETHLDIFNPEYKQKVLNNLLDWSDFYDSNKSFCHGDFSLDNMINSEEELYLIDPIYDDFLYSSWLLDVSKLLQSSKRHENFVLYDYYIHKYNHIKIPILLLELTHWIRMRKYSSIELQKTIDNNINMLLKELC